MTLITSCAIYSEPDLMYSLYKSGMSGYFDFHQCNSDIAFSCAISALRYFGYEIREIDEKHYRIYGKKWDKYARLYDVDDFTAAIVEVEYIPSLETSKVTLSLIEVKEGIRGRMGFYQISNYEYYKPFFDKLERLINLKTKH